MILRSFLFFLFASLIPVGFCQGVERAPAGQREVGRETVATARASSPYSSFQVPVIHLSSCVVLTKPPYTPTHVPYHHENLLAYITFVHASLISLIPSSNLTSIYWWDPDMQNSLLWQNIHSIRFITLAILSIQFSSIRYIHGVVQSSPPSISRSFSSFRAETVRFKHELLVLPLPALGSLYSSFNLNFDYHRY